MSGIIAVLIFIISLFFSLALFCVWLRIGLRYLRVSSLHPVSQFVTKITDPLVHPIQLLLGNKNNPKQKIDPAVLITLVLLEFLKIIIMSFLLLQALIPIVMIVIYVLADLLIQPCNLLFYAILLRVIMSYVNPQWQGPIADILRQLTEPLLILGRKIVPNISGFDFSPFIILILLQVITLFIEANLPWRLL